MRALASFLSEGMAFGLPALATTRPAGLEIITSGRDGFWSPPGT